MRHRVEVTWFGLVFFLFPRFFSLCGFETGLHLWFCVVLVLRFSTSPRPSPRPSAVRTAVARKPRSGAATTGPARWTANGRRPVVKRGDTKREENGKRGVGSKHRKTHAEEPFESNHLILSREFS